MELRAHNGAVIDASDGLAPKLLAAGWRRVEPEPPTADLAAMTVAQLRAMCAERGVDAPKRATKAQLIRLIEG